MSSETTEARYFFTTDELAAMTDTDIGRIRDQILSEHGEREAREHLKPWHEALEWATNPSYRERRVAEEHGRVWPPKLASEPVPEPEPTLAMPSRPQVTVRSGMTRADGKIIAGAVKSHLRKKYLTRDEVNSLLSAMNQRLREQEETIREMRQQTDRRFAANDQRFDAASRHRRNLQAQINHEPIEHSARTVSTEEPRQ